MDEKFTTSNKGDPAYAEMHRVKYQGSVMIYIDKLIGLNKNVNMSGCALRTVLVYSLSHELRKNLAKLYREKPKEEDDLLSAIKEVGLTHEECYRDEKLKNKDSRASPLKRAKEIANTSWSLRR